MFKISLKLSLKEFKISIDFIQQQTIQNYFSLSLHLILSSIKNIIFKSRSSRDNFHKNHNTITHLLKKHVSYFLFPLSLVEYVSMSFHKIS